MALSLILLRQAAKTPVFYHRSVMLRQWATLPRFITTLLDLQTIAEARQRTAEARNPFTRFGANVFSQSDEDGLIAEIVRRLGIERGRYCEFGVGNGLECNTLALAAQGWSGFWIGGENIAFDHGSVPRSFFHFDKQWVTLDNAVDLFRDNLAAMGADDVDLLSLDLDSTDYFFVESLLQAGASPKLFIVEYNAKFFPPIRWRVEREENLIWKGTDYFGASLQSFADLFARFGYALICCNAATGANAFFVKTDDLSKFPEVPASIQDIYIGPNFRVPSRVSHRPDPRTAARAIALGSILAGEAAERCASPTVAQVVA